MSKIEYFCSLNLQQKNSKMEQNNTRENTEMGGVINATEAFIEKNKKLLVWAIIVVIVLILAIFGLSRWNNGRNVKANDQMFAAEQLFAAGQYELALNGDATHTGLLEVAKQYGCTKAGQRAKYTAALCYLNTQQFAEAQKMLKSYRPKDKFTRLMKEVNLGSAALELGNTAQAHSHFQKAIRKADKFDEVLTHTLFLDGMTYLMEGNKEKARAQFSEIKNYPSTAEYRNADQYIGLTE